MPDRIRLGRRFDHDAWFGLVRNALAFAAAVAAIGWASQFAPRNSPWPTVGAVLGAPLVVLAAAWVYRRVRSVGGPELTLSDDGFVLHGDRDRVVADADVTELGSVVQVMARNGHAVAYRRRLTLGLTGGERLDLVHDDDTLTADPLGPLIFRLLQQHQVAARNELSAGGAVAGDGWTLTARELRFTADGAVAVLRLDRLAACQEVESVVCAWAAGVAEPVFRRPSDTPNALLLLALLESVPRSDSPPPAAAPAPPAITPPPAAWDEVPLVPAGDGLGRLLHERDRSLTPELRLALFAAAGLALVLTAYAGQAVYRGVGGKVELYLLFLGPAGAFGAVRWAGWRHVSRLRVHAHGVSYTSPRGTAELRYADVGAVTFNAVRSYTNGVYQGTNATLTLAPADPRAGGPITVHAVYQNEDPGLDAACDEACRAVAGRMLAELTAGRSVPWAAGLTLTPDGVQPRRGEPVAYHRLGWQTAGGKLTLRADGRKLAAVGDDEPNFFPGAVVLEQMYAAATAGEPVAG